MAKIITKKDYVEVGNLELITEPYSTFEGNLGIDIMYYILDFQEEDIFSIEKEILQEFKVKTVTTSILENSTKGLKLIWTIKGKDNGLLEFTTNSKSFYIKYF